MGTHPVKDLLGMGMEVDMLMRRFNPGRLSVFAQLDTFRISQSDLSTVCKDPMKGVIEGDSLGEDHMINTIFTK